VQSLLARGADVDAVDEQGQTPLHAAVALHHEEVAGELLARGAALHIVRVRTHSHSLIMMVPALARVSTSCHNPAQLVFFRFSDAVSAA
jgi:ankyrin repeat protein